MKFQIFTKKFWKICFVLPDNGCMVQKSSSSGFNKSNSSMSKAVLIGGNGIEDPAHTQTGPF